MITVPDAVGLWGPLRETEFGLQACSRPSSKRRCNLLERQKLSGKRPSLTPPSLGLPVTT